MCKADCGVRYHCDVPATTGLEALEIDDVGLVTRVLALDLRVTAVLDELARAEGLAGADYLVLGAIRLSPGGLGSPVQVARLLGRSRGGLTLTLDRLERDGWIRRAPDPGDGRRVIVELTGAGRRAATVVNEALHRWQDDLDLSDGARDRIERALDELLVAVGVHD